MSEKRSLSAQRQNIEHCLALLETLAPGEHKAHIEIARQGCLSLAWFEKRTELTREIVRLEKAAPELSALLHQIPGVQIADVRFYDEREAAE